MKRTHALIPALLGLLSLPLLSPLHAQVSAAPSLMKFQGRLAKPDGTPVADGTYSVRFSLWNALSAGTETWNQTLASVNVKNGTFAVQLSGFPANAFNTNQWLEIKIGTSAPLTPRQQLVSVPYAMKANTVPDGSIGAAQLANDAASLSKVSGGVLSSDATSTALNNQLLRLRDLGDPNHGLGYFNSYGGSDLDGPALFGFGGGVLGYQNTRVLTWTSQGRVGIGTAAPATTLDVNGIAQMTGFKLTAGAGAGKVLTSDASGTGTWQTAAGAGWNLAGNASTSPATNFLGTTDNQPLVFRTNNIERMRISSGSDIGLQITGNNLLEFGFGVSNKEVNAGRIAYQRFSDGLDIIGAGTNNTNRKVQFWAEGGTTFSGPIQTTGTATMTGFRLSTGAAANRVLVSDAAGLGSWSAVTNSMIQSVDWSKITNAPSGSSGWSLAGNSGTNPASNFLGTADNQPLVFKVNGFRAMQYQYVENTSVQNATWRSINVLGGTDINSIGAGVVGATIAGGGMDYVVGSKYPNRVLADLGTVGGGVSNTANGYAATVAGGLSNTATGRSIAIAGGENNSATVQYAAVGGGLNNTAGGRSANIPGGENNAASGHWSFAAGRRAKALHQGAFVWADSGSPIVPEGTDFASTTDNQFNVRASGGVRIFTRNDLSTGVLLAPGSGTWSSASDRNLKANFQTVDTLDVLEKLIAMPLTTWNYKANTDIRHMGMMAQDFHAAFGGLGLDDKHIDTVDADGVAFAAIQGLNKKLEAKEKRLQKVEAENTAIRAENAEFKARLEALEAAVQRLTAQPK